MNVFFSPTYSKIIDVLNPVTNIGFLYEGELARVKKDYKDALLISVECALALLKLLANRVTVLDYNAYLKKQAIEHNMFSVNGLEWFTLFGSEYLETYVSYGGVYSLFETEYKKVRLWNNSNYKLMVKK